MIRRLLVTASLALILVAGTAAAAAPSAVAELSNDGASLSWQPLTAHAGLVLTIAGPDGLSLRREFTGAPVLSIFDDAGQTLPDGSYTYELIASPRIGPAARRAMEAARGNDRAMAELRRNGMLPEARVQSGSFAVAGGAFVIASSGEEELGAAVDTAAVENLSGAATLTPMSAAAQVFTTDLIVQGSECVGVDCSTSESFGSDTIRLKENNLRIHFDDTSNSGSFPRNDWRLIANDSSNGGLSYLAIEDSTAGTVPFRVVAGAGNNALYVDAQGDVGVGTSSPVVELQVTDGDSPTLRLEQNNSSGFAAQTWDLAGNETNFFVRDVTNASSLPFRIFPGSATDDALVIAANGNVGIGTTSPDNQLDVDGGGLRVTNVGSSSANFALVELVNTGASNNQTWTLANNGTNGAFLIDNGAVGNSAFRVFPNAATNLMDLGGAGAQLASTVTVNGTLNVTTAIQLNGTQEHPDYVFEPDYPLPSIAEQGRYMMTNKHLPAVGKGEGPIDLRQHQFGVLEELEKAHLYIQQLHGTIEELRRENRSNAEVLAEVLARLEQLQTR